MSKLYFAYSAMNAGKTTIVLQASHNYGERCMKTLLLTSQLDESAGAGTIASLIGLSAAAETFASDTDLIALITQHHEKTHLSCVLVDEAQFLTSQQVWDLAHIADHHKIPVMCYGLRTDFQGNLFEGSATLLAVADNLREIRTICHCGSKATMVVRQTQGGDVIREGDQIEIGGNDKYVSLCRKHWSEVMGR